MRLPALQDNGFRQDCTKPLTAPLRNNQPSLNGVSAIGSVGTDFQIRDVVVQRVAVQVIDDESIWDVAVMELPNKAVRAASVEFLLVVIRYAEVSVFFLLI